MASSISLKKELNFSLPSLNIVTSLPKYNGDLDVLSKRFISCMYSSDTFPKTLSSLLISSCVTVRLDSKSISLVSLLFFQFLPKNKYTAKPTKGKTAKTNSQLIVFSGLFLSRITTIIAITA